MKIIFTLLLLWLSSAYPQATLFRDKVYLTSGRDTTLTWNSTLSRFDLIVPTTLISESFQLSKSGTGVTGNWGIIVSPDTLGTDSEADTMIFFPEYWGGASIGWVLGDTMQFHTRFDSARTGGFADTTTFIIDNAGDGVKYFWQSSPADSFSIASFPIQRVRVRGKILDATVAKLTHYGLKAEILIDIR